MDVKSDDDVERSVNISCGDHRHGDTLCRLKGNRRHCSDASRPCSDLGGSMSAAHHSASIQSVGKLCRTCIRIFAAWLLDLDDRFLFESYHPSASSVWQFHFNTRQSL